MARAYQISCPPGSATLIADLETKPGGANVTIKNNHATEALLVGGDENELNASLGGDTLTSANGYRLAAGASLNVTLFGGESVYGRGATSTVTISVSVFRTNYRS